MESAVRSWPWAASVSVAAGGCAACAGSDVGAAELSVPVGAVCSEASAGPGGVASPSVAAFSAAGGVSPGWLPQAVTDAKSAAAIEMTAILFFISVLQCEKEEPADETGSSYNR